MLNAQAARVGQGRVNEGIPSLCLANESQSPVARWQAKKTSQSAVAAAAWALSMAASDDDDVKAAAAFVASGSILKIV